MGNLAEAVGCESLCEICEWDDDECCKNPKRKSQPVDDCEDFLEDLSECSQSC